MRLRHLLLMLLPFPALAQVGSLHGTLRDAETKQPLADVTVTATSPRLEVGQVTVTNAAGEYRIEKLPPGLYVLTFERPAFLRSIRNPVALRARRQVRVDVALLSECAAAGFLRHAAPAPREQGCAGRVDDTCVPQLEVACTEPRDAAVRAFVPLAELAPRSDVIVYAVSREWPENVFILDGIGDDISKGPSDDQTVGWRHPSPSTLRPSGVPQALRLPQHVREP